MNCLYDIKVIPIASMEKELSYLTEHILHIQNVFEESIRDIIKNTGLFPVVGDLIKPIGSLDESNPTPHGRTIYGREFDANKRLIIYEIG